MKLGSNNYKGNKKEAERVLGKRSAKGTKKQDQRRGSTMSYWQFGGARVRMCGGRRETEGRCHGGEGGRGVEEQARV